MSMFGAKATDNYDGFQIASLAPGIYKNYELKDVKKELTTKADGTNGKRILTFLFDGAEGPFQHTEFDILPTDTGAEKKAENMVKRIGHILSKYISKDVIKANTAETFEELCDWAMTSLGNAYVGVKVDFKIVGNTYNNKNTSGFPGYLPFIVKAGEPISFDNNQQLANKKYLETANAANTPDSEKTNQASPGAQAGVEADF